MIHFVSIAAFRTALEALLKVKRDVYAGVSDEICKAFQNVPIEQIRSNRDMILIDNESITIKLRLADKKHRLSKSDGYRLIYMVMKNIPMVALLTIYPKRGPLQKINMEDVELQTLVSDFVTESRARTLVLHDVYDNLKEIL